MSKQIITTPSGTYTVELPQGWTRARALKAGETTREGTYVLHVSIGDLTPLRVVNFGRIIQAEGPRDPEGYYFVDDPTPVTTNPAPVASNPIPVSIPEEQIVRGEDLTHSGEFFLSNGAKLSIARDAKGWLLMGEWNGVNGHIGFSNEAMEVIATTFLVDGANLIPIKRD